MKLALYIKDKRFENLEGFRAMCSELISNGNELYSVQQDSLQEGTDICLSIGGDGTFLSAANMAAKAGVPLAGVNFGRMGFLSEFRPDRIAGILAEKKYFMEQSNLLDVHCGSQRWFALNELSVLRSGAAMLGVEVNIDGTDLPTYWADGLLVSTSSGSTAYSLSVGGPICTPGSEVFIIAPVAPHNLNARPLIVPSSAKIKLKFRSRDKSVNLTCDNIGCVVPASSEIAVCVAQFSLKRLRLSKASFIEALRSKLFWGEDVRNET